MRFQKLPLRFDVNVTRSTLIARRSAKNGRSGMLRRTTTASQQRVFCGNLRRRDYVTRKRPPERLEAAQYDNAIKARTSETTIMETPAKQIPTASSETVKLIRKLRWVGLEERAEQLEKELEEHAVADTVVSIQCETD
jgi:hypothetical protein